MVSWSWVGPPDDTCCCHEADRLVTALSGRRVDLGARRVWGKLGNLLGLLSPLLVTSVSFVRVVSQRLHGARSLVATGRERRV